MLMRVPTRPVDGNAVGEASSAGSGDEPGLAPSPVALPVLVPVGRMRAGAMGSVGTWPVTFMVRLPFNRDEGIEASSG